MQSSARLDEAGKVRSTYSPVLTVAGRNLLTLTGFDGVGPEADAHGASTLGGGGFHTQPLPASPSLRLTRRW